jgi:UDP-3-O-[3-hydroxymyristoyl] glucosamine N-acyltransferase
MQFSLNQVTHILGGSLEGDGEVKISALSNIEEGKPGTISFLSNPKYEPHIYTTNASAVIVRKDFEPKQVVNAALIRVDDPYLSFTALLEE